jgi:TrmH family RNA methyltransferase
MEYSFNVVLVEPLYSTNIGASARALANMGGGRLILISPQAAINSQARQGAAGAQEQLQKTVVYESWGDFLKLEAGGAYIALSKRGGKSRSPLPIEEGLSKILNDRTEELPPIYFVFGREDNGLSTEDILKCDFTCSLPEYGNFSSYNLSQAVLLTLYIAHQSMPKAINAEKTKRSLDFPDEALKNWLLNLGFDLEAPRINAFTTLKRMIQRSLPTDKEISSLEAALQQSLRKNKNL